MMILSILAAEDNWTVLLGGKQEIFPILDKLPNGIFLLKSIVPGEIHIQNKLKECGHKIATIDAEGLIMTNGEAGVRARFAQETIDETDMAFFWGDKQYHNVNNVFTTKKEKSIITGSPVFDFWRMTKNNNLKKVRKKNILIATSFPAPNSIVEYGHTYDMIRSVAGKNATEKQLEEMFLPQRAQEESFKPFINMVKEVAKAFPSYTILLRPHPRENKDTWKKITDKKTHERTKKLFTKENKLFIKISSAPLRNELSNNKVILLSKIKEEHNFIDELYFI